MSLNSQETSARDRTFVAQVRQAAITTALTVSAEGSAVTNHASRSALATRVLSQPTDDLFSAFAQAAVSDGSTAPGVSDAALLTRIAAVWNGLSGGL